MTKVGEIIDGFLFKKDPCAVYPKEEILARFVHRLNSQRDPMRFPAPYNQIFIELRMKSAGLKNAALLCWFYDYCSESKHFTDTWINSL